MSNENQETIADIVDEMRKRAEEVYAGQAGYPESWEDQMNDDEIREIADRIEAAHKREREAGADAAQICGKIGEMIGREAACKETVTDCHALGNAANMREAFDNIAEYAKAAACHTEDAHLLGYLNQIERWAEAALSAQPRNCDVGTAKEQEERFSKFCTSHYNRNNVDGECDSCPLKEVIGVECAIAWSQLPYEEGGTK